MCQRHQNAYLFIKQFTDELFPTTQSLLDQAALQHGGFTVLEDEQQLLHLFLEAKEHIEHLMKYDVKLVFPTISAILHKQSQPDKISLSELNSLYRNTIAKLNTLIQKAFMLKNNLSASNNSEVKTIFNFFDYIGQHFITAYTERLNFFEEWYSNCRCMRAFNTQDPNAINQ